MNAIVENRVPAARQPLAPLFLDQIELLRTQVDDTPDAARNAITCHVQDGNISE